MSNAKYLPVQESHQELKRLQKSSKLIFVPRIRMLLLMKQYGEKGISKRDLADQLGVNHNSIQTWRTMYQQGGLDLLLSHKKTGFKPSVFSLETQQALKEKLSNPENGIRGYMELLRWLEERDQKQYCYNTLVKFCIRHFGSSIKVARKSHINKDIEAVEAFKKNLN